MLVFLRSWIINIVTISIILILFEIIIPTGKIKKIINLVSGFILLIAVINPFLTLKNQDFDLGANTIADSFYIDKKELEASSKILEETQMKQISTIYKKKLISKILEEMNKLEGIAETKVEVVINEDHTSERFGEINKIFVAITKGNEQDKSVEIEPVISVEKVDISTSSAKNKNIKSLKVLDTESIRLTELVKENLNKTLEIQKDNIIVTVT